MSLNFNSHNHNQHAGRPCFSLAVLIERSNSTLCEDISPTETVHRASAGLRFMRAPIVERRLNRGPTNRRAPLANSALDSDADGNRAAL
jgi:hypothetical protein